MGLYESLSGQVKDDGSPARALNVAGQATIKFNRSVRLPTQSQ